jgi:UDP-N-acetyl-D-galactosamine dehydrogenase
LRNSRAFDLVARLRQLGHKVEVADPLADAAELHREHQLSVVNPAATQYDLVIGAVAHSEYRAYTSGDLDNLLVEGGILADLKGIWRDRQLKSSVVRWSL